MSAAVDQAGIDYHVVLAQNALQQCLDMAELQAELICALIKQTSKSSPLPKLGVQVSTQKLLKKSVSVLFLLSFLKKATETHALGGAVFLSSDFCETQSHLGTITPSYTEHSGTLISFKSPSLKIFLAFCTTIKNIGVSVSLLFFYFVLSSHRDRIAPSLSLPPRTKRHTSSSFSLNRSASFGRPSWETPKFFAAVVAVRDTEPVHVRDDAQHK